MRKNIESGGSCDKFSDKSFINFLKVFLHDLIFRSIPVTRNPPQKLSLSDAPNVSKGSKKYYKLKPELTEANVFVTKATCFEWEPATIYATEVKRGPTVNNQTMERLRCFLWKERDSSKRDPTVMRTVNGPDETTLHKDLILGLTCCIRLYGKRFNFIHLRKYLSEEMYQKLCNPTNDDYDDGPQILIDRASIIGLLWAITQMRKPFIFDSISKSLFKEYFESTTPIEAQNLIYILALGKRLDVLNAEKIEKSMQNLSSAELLNSLSVSDWIIALSCMDNDNYQIVTKIMNLVVEEIDGMDINLSVVYLSTLVHMKASSKRYPLSYRKIMARIENIFSDMPVNDSMSHLFHLLCQIQCDMKGFFESICTKVIRIMHLIPLCDMVKLMCAIAIYRRNCEKVGNKYEDATRIPSFMNLENHVITKITCSPPFPKELLNLIHDSIIDGKKIENDEELSKLTSKNKFYAASDKSVNKSHNDASIFKSKNSMELENDQFELSSEERFFCANLLEDCCTNIEKLDSDVIMQLVYSLLTFKVDMTPLGTAVKRLVDESVMQEIEPEEMGFSVNLSSEMSDVVSQYRVAESIIHYAHRGKQVKDKFDFTDTQRQLESTLGIIMVNSRNSSKKPHDNSTTPALGSLPVNNNNNEKREAMSKNANKPRPKTPKHKEPTCGTKDSKLAKSKIIEPDNTHVKTSDSNEAVLTDHVKKQLSQEIPHQNTTSSENDQGKHTNPPLKGISGDHYDKNALEPIKPEGSSSNNNKCKRDGRQSILPSIHGANANTNADTSASTSNVKSGQAKSPVCNVKVSNNDKLASDKTGKYSVFGRNGESVGTFNNPQSLFGINNPLPIVQAPTGAHPQYSTSMNISAANNYNQNLPRHPQFSTHSQGSTDRPYSLYPQFSTSVQQQQQIQHQMHLNHLNNQLQNQLHGQMGMINPNSVQTRQEFMMNPTYANYQNYYTSGASNNMNPVSNNVHKGNTGQNIQENTFSGINEQNYQTSGTQDGVSNISYRGIESGNPHMSNPLPVLCQNYEAYNPHHYIDPPMPTQPLNTQQLNNPYARYDNECFPKPSSILDLKNQIHIIELEIERERLKELERKMAFMNN